MAKGSVLYFSVRCWWQPALLDDRRWRWLLRPESPAPHPPCHLVCFSSWREADARGRPARPPICRVRRDTREAAGSRSAGPDLRESAGGLHPPAVPRGALCFQAGVDRLLHMREIILLLIEGSENHPIVCEGGGETDIASRKCCSAAAVSLLLAAMRPRNSSARARSTSSSLSCHRGCLVLAATDDGRGLGVVLAQIGERLGVVRIERRQPFQIPLSPVWRGRRP